jgi:MFS family permease
MYGYRKAFTAAGFEHQSFWGIDLKIWLVTAQVLGYMASKFYGVKFIAENRRENRWKTILTLILFSWLALLGFALVPSPYNIPFLFANGFPLGMIWGLVFSFVEGRRSTEIIGAVLASSFIFASGFARSMGKWLTNDMGIQEHWMPFAAGAIYLLPMTLFTLLLEAIPNPSPADVNSRSVRAPMTHADRKAFLRRFLPGLVPLIIAYVLLTVLRDFRDNFSNEILGEAGFGGQAGIFTRVETPVALLVLAVMATLVFVRSNYKAFFLNHFIILAGFALAGTATLLYSHHWLSPFYWFLLTGAGLYMGYIPVNTIYFERLLATFGIKGNVGFLIYVADSFGYLGSVAVLFLRQFFTLSLSWTGFFVSCIYTVSTVGIVCTCIAMLNFHKQYKAHQRI